MARLGRSAIGKKNTTCINITGLFVLPTHCLYLRFSYDSYYKKQFISQQLTGLSL